MSDKPRIGYAPGIYDLFHVGHLNIFRESRAFCDHLIAGVLSDEMSQRTKGITPVIPLVERIAPDALDCVVIGTGRMLDAIHENPNIRRMLEKASKG